MTKEQLDLAERLVHSPAWRWLPGMLDVADKRVTALIPAHIGHERYWLECAGLDINGEDAILHLGVEDMGLPDLSDPATVGCLIHLVCEVSTEEVGRLVEGVERQGSKPSLTDLIYTKDYS